MLCRTCSGFGLGIGTGTLANNALQIPELVPMPFAFHVGDHIPKLVRISSRTNSCPQLVRLEARHRS